MAQNREMQLMFLLEEPPARASAWRDFALALLTRAETSCSRSVHLLDYTVRGGSFGRTSPVSCRPTADGILESSLGSWGNAGMGSPTEFLTLNMSEHTGLSGLSLKDDGVSSLSDILETGVLPQRYYLSPKACAGILHRAERRRKDLPDLLRAALANVAEDADP